MTRSPRAAVADEGDDAAGERMRITLTMTLHPAPSLTDRPGIVLLLYSFGLAWIKALRHPAQDEKLETANRVSGLVIDAGLKIHRALGPGLLESAYERCLAHELQKCGLTAERQVPMPLLYDGIELDVGYRLDLLVGDQVIVEIKAAETLMPVHEAQLLTYLKLSGRRVGLLMNFNMPMFRQGVRRIVI